MRIRSREKYYRITGQDFSRSESFYETFTMPVHNFIAWRAYCAYDRVLNLPGFKQVNTVLSKWLDERHDNTCNEAWDVCNHMPLFARRAIRRFLLGRKNRQVTGEVPS